MNKGHATIFLTRLIGSSDGKWSSIEMDHALKLGTLSSALEEAPDWGDKILSGELNETSSYYILNNLTREDQMDCLVTCLITSLADGSLDDSEVTVISRILNNLNKGITTNELVESYKTRLAKLRG
jgi:hypothetical protein